MVEFLCFSILQIGHCNLKKISNNSISILNNSNGKITKNERIVDRYFKVVSSQFYFYYNKSKTKGFGQTTSVEFKCYGT